ncbi:hypothetical protein Syun_015448 [Stephania yunnanensis]|uniref:Uncharacterized protein n=1 Tax=Stephania yunnanensis TaxID=152371 RepID=A0AAP0P9D1_9MAGN
MPTVQASAAASAGRRPHQPRRLPPTSRIVAAPLLAGPAAAPRRSSLSHRHPSLSAISLSLSLCLSLSRRSDLSFGQIRSLDQIWPREATESDRATPRRTCRCAAPELPLSPPSFSFRHFSLCLSLSRRSDLSFGQIRSLDQIWPREATGSAAASAGRRVCWSDLPPPSSVVAAPLLAGPAAAPVITAAAAVTTSKTASGGKQWIEEKGYFSLFASLSPDSMSPPSTTPKSIANKVIAISVACPTMY